MRTLPRTLLAYTLLAGFYLVALYLALSCGWASIGLLIAAIRHPTEVPVWLYPIGAATFCVFVSIVRGVVAARLPTQVRMDAVQVSAEDEPRLWATVIELARRVGAPAPMELWLTAEPNASVSEEAWPLRTRLGVRRMYIGVPLLVGLSTDQPRAVLCHELGHYADMHTPLGAIAYRGSLALMSVRERVRRSHRRRMAILYWYQWLTLLYLWGYGRLYDRLTFTIRRRQEIEADLAAARVVGKNVMIDALRSTHVLVTAWRDFNFRFLSPMCGAGHVPENPFEPFVAMLTDPRYREVLAGYRQRSPEPPRFRLDTHPPLEERLSRLARCSARSAGVNPSPATEILDDPQGLFSRVWEVNIHHDDKLPIRDWLNLIGGYQAAQRARELEQALGQRCETAQRPPTLDAILSMLETGDNEMLAERLGDIRGEPQQGGDLLRDAVYAVAGHSLVLAGRARWTVDWAARGSTWCATGTTPADIRRLVSAAVLAPREARGRRLGLAKPTAARRLRQRLIRLGADATKPLRIDSLDRAAADRTTHRRFRALGGLTIATSLLLCAAAVVSGVSAYAYFKLASAHESFYARALLFGPNRSEQANLDKALSLVQIASLLGPITVLVTGVVFIVWQYSYARNAETLRGPLDFGPGWAIAGWITPFIVNLAVPFIALPALALAWMFVSFATFALPFVQLNQSAKASDPELPADAGWQRGRAPIALKGWAAACIAAALFRVVSTDARGEPSDSLELQIHDLVLSENSKGMSMLVFVFAGLAGILMVQRLAEHQRQAITKAQERLADEHTRVL